MKSLEMEVKDLNGLVCVYSGEHTARYSKGKYIVDEGGASIAYNQYHKPCSLETFMDLWIKAGKRLAKGAYSGKYQVGNHQEYNIHVHLEATWEAHTLFAEHLFLPIKDTPMENWSLRCVPDFKPSDDMPVFIGICLSEKKVLILGSGYCGEIKKSMFSVMNLLLPEQDILSMHCSAVLSPKGDTSLLLGLSGTGKTTLSSSPFFQLIGDDEHAWSDEGIFNLEGGCYAKTIHLTEEAEPEIYQALIPPAILENTVLNNGVADFCDASITENLRAAYPLSHIPNAYTGIAPHPKDIIFLCCDLHGVIPAVSWLTPKQAVDYYMLGYTAKIGATEVGVNSIQSVTSPLFGQPFFGKKLAIYRNLFEQKLKQHTPRVWLVNTGWGAGGYLGGKRMPLADTRQIIHAITSGNVHFDSLNIHPILKLRYLERIDGVSSELSLPTEWIQSPAFYDAASKLQQSFQAVLDTQTTD